MKTAPRLVTRLNSLIFIGVFIILAAVVAVPFYSASSRSLDTHKTDSKSAPMERIGTEASTASANPALWWTSKYLALPLPPPVETISTYEVDGFGACTATPKNSFNLGETVCAKITGAPLGTVDRAATRIGWVSPYGSLTQGAAITTDPQNGYYLIPSTATQTFTDAGGSTVTVDNRGTWGVGIYSASDGSLREAALFTVHDPAKAFVDLSVHQSVTISGGEVGAGSGGVFDIFVTNSGPDAAQAVVLSDTLSDNATFSAIVDDGFTCGAPVGTLFTCTLASLPAGTKHLTLSYTVNGDTPVGATITNTVSVSSSDTPCASSPAAPCELQPNDNSSTATAEVPAEAPGQTCTLLCHANFSVIADAFQGATHGSYVFFGAASGNGSCGAITSTFDGIPITDPPTAASGAFYPVGTTVIHVSSETGGGSCSFTITVVEGTPPTITCPPDQSATASTQGGTHTFTALEIGTPATNPTTNVIVTFERSDNIPATYDANGNVLTPEVVYSLTDPFPSGTTGINWTVTDTNGLAASCTQRILVHGPCTTDIEPPTITAPPAVTANTGPNSTTCGVALSPSDDELGTPVVHDDCSATVTITGIPPGNLFPVGVTTLTYTATDGSGHTASANQTVTVIDNTVPVIVAPANASYICPSEVPAGSPAQAHGNNPALLNGGPVFDNCGVANVTVSDSSTGAGSAASPLIITRTFTATDIHGNSASAVQIITVTDPTPPTFTSVPANASYQCASEVPAASPSQATASDNCTPPTITVADSSTGAGSTASPLIITRTYTATDAAGNSTDAVQTITVIDNTPPTLSVTAPAGASADASCQAAVPTVAYTTNDNCGAGGVTVTQSPAAGTLVSLGTTSITVTAKDAVGNTTSKSVDFSVVDTTPPTLNATTPATVSADANCQAPVPTVAYTTSDNCSAVTVTQSPAAGTLVTIGPNVITLTAKDVALNTTIKTVIFTVVDTTPPVFTSCPSDITLEPTCPSGAKATWAQPTATDNCGVTVTRTSPGPANGAVFPIGTTQVIYIADDGHGNTATCSFSVTVKTVTQTLNDLKASVNSSSLNGTQKQGLIAKIDAALDALAIGHTSTACQKLADFINSTQNYIDHGNISAVVGNAWISTAAHVRNTIGCTNNPCT